MADGSAEAAFLSSMRTAESISADGDGTVNGQDAQIDSSDEYDPSAQSFQDVSYAPPESFPASTDPPVHSPKPSSTPITTQTPISLDTQQRPQSAAAPAPMKNGTVPSPAASSPAVVPKTRLPHDRIGILEDRIAEDEKGDLQAWLELIEEHKKRGKLDEVRKVYDRFFQVFPTAANEYVALVQLENDAGNRREVEKIFSKTLKDLPSLELWSAYLNHIRRYHNITLDKSGRASQINHGAYEAVLKETGIDRDAGPLWLDYISFIKSGPGVIGGSSWQDGQKMDVLRRAYQQAIVTPHQSIENIWKDYTNFETGINKQTGRKFLQDKSPDYMTARTAFNELQNITRGLSRTSLPRLPPAPGFDGHEEYMQQLDIWKRWIEWEKNDPLVLKQEDAPKWKQRVVYVYKQALMALRFWPEMWLDAAEFCFHNELESQGNGFLSQGIAANPESALLAFRQADRLELSTTNGNDDDSKAARGDKVKEPYVKCLDALYSLISKVQASEAKQVAATEAQTSPATNGVVKNSIEEEEDDAAEDPVASAAEKVRKDRIANVKAFHKAQVDQLCKTITHVWIVTMRAFQRMQGKGNPGKKIGGSRGIFQDARKRGRLTSELFAAAALLEYHTGEKEPANKIFERGSKLFPKDEKFALDYIKFLVLTNDTTNARVVFETTVTKLQSDPDDTIKLKAKPLFVWFRRFESQYGELSQVMKLEGRMHNAFPDDPQLSSFSSRFIEGEGVNAFDPTAVHPIISPNTQTKPRTQPLIREPVQAPVAITNSPRAALAQPLGAISSPKRPLPVDLADSPSERVSKMPRGESPLKGAAGRRLNQANSTSTPVLSGGVASLPQLGGPPPIRELPREINFLLSIIPPASTYHSTKFSPDEMVKLVQGLRVPSSVEEWQALRASAQTPMAAPGVQPLQPPYGMHGRF